VTAAELAATLTHPLKAQLVRICLSVFQNFGERPDWQQASLMADAQDVRDGRPTPCLSRKEREAVQAAWEKESANG
jgi:hypothetical protein